MRYSPEKPAGIVGGLQAYCPNSSVGPGLKGMSQMNKKFPTRLIIDVRDGKKDLFMEYLSVPQWREAKAGETRRTSTGRIIKVCGLAWDTTNQAFSI